MTATRRINFVTGRARRLSAAAGALAFTVIAGAQAQIATSSIPPAFVPPAPVPLTSTPSVSVLSFPTPAANSVHAPSLVAPANAPAWLARSWQSLLSAPLPSLTIPSGVPAVLPQLYVTLNETGQFATYQPAGSTTTASNAFFQPLGTNGRTCATCHTPSDAMSISVSTIRQRYLASGGADPLFAPVDGATCPKNVPQARTHGALLGGLTGTFGAAPTPISYATILTRGLFRIALPVPDNAQFKVEVVSDPYGCNTDPQYGKVVQSNGQTTQIISVYRRSMMAASLKFKVNTAVNAGGLPPVDLIDGSPLPTYTAPTGAPYGVGGNGAIENSNIENGNIMSDGREPTLASQAIDATLGHAQALNAPTQAQVAQILAFEGGIYAAQYTDNMAGLLAQGNVAGGPVNLAGNATGTLGASPVMSIYNAWNPANGFEFAQRASIYRGQQLFNKRTFTVSNVAGFNNALGSNAFTATCSTCHGQTNVGDDPTPIAQHNIGTDGSASAIGGPAPVGDLPVFRLTCTGGAQTPYNGTVVVTNDPGKALITGKCADIGRFTVGRLRGLSARAPYFHDGIAPGLIDVVNFYKRRFGIIFTAQDETDLVNFLQAL